MSSIFSFPPEIVEVIVNEIADHDIPELKKTLRICSIVSSSFRDPSQRRLFRSVHLEFEIDDGSSRRNARLLDILSSNSRIVSFIRILWLGIGTTFYCAPGLSAALCALPRVREITLEITQSLIRWKCLPEDFKVDLLQLVQSPTVRRLSLGEVDFPVEYLRSLTHIERIDLMPFFGAHLDTVPLPIMPLVIPEETHLDALSMTTQFYIWDELLSALGDGISRLRRFKTFITYARDIAQIQDVLDASAGVLHWFGYFWHTETERSLPRHLDLTKLSNLQHLYIGLYNVKSMEHVLAWTCLVLRTIPEINRIVTIVIKSSLEPDLQCTVWSEIDELLTTERFVTLRRVVVSMRQRIEHLGLSGVQFPRLSAKGYFFERSALTDSADWQ